MVASARWLHCHLYGSDLIFCLYCCIYDQKESLVSIASILSWWPWGNFDPFLYQELSNVGTTVIEEGFRNVQWEGDILWECINFKEELGVKLIYLLIDHNASLSIIIHLPAFRDLILQCRGSPPPLNMYPLRMFLPFEIVLH